MCLWPNFTHADDNNTLGNVRASTWRRLHSLNNVVKRICLTSLPLLAVVIVWLPFCYWLTPYLLNRNVFAVGWELLYNSILWLIFFINDLYVLEKLWSGYRGFPDGSSGKEPACQCRRQKRIWSLGQEDPLEECMATHSSTLAWKIPWTEEPGRLQSMG